MSRRRVDAAQAGASAVPTSSLGSCNRLEVVLQAGLDRLSNLSLTVNATAARPDGRAKFVTLTDLTAPTDAPDAPKRQREDDMAEVPEEVMALLDELGNEPANAEARRRAEAEEEKRLTRVRTEMRIEVQAAWEAASASVKSQYETQDRGSSSVGRPDGSPGIPDGSPGGIPGMAEKQASAEPLVALSTVLDTLLMNDSIGKYTFDKPSESFEKIVALQTDFLAICASNKIYNVACQDPLIALLQTQVTRTRRVVLPRHRVAAEGANPGKPLRNLDEWDVWDVMARRNNEPMLRDLKYLETNAVLKDENNPGYYKTSDNRTIYLGNAKVMAMLAHVWSIPLWAERHMIVYPPVVYHGPDVSIRFTHPMLTPAHVHGNNHRRMKDDFGPHLEAWDVSNMTSMHLLLYGMDTFDEPIGAWNVSKVKNMRGLFGEAKQFNQPIGAWDVGCVETMQGMFHNAKAFNQSIGNWNVTGVKDMQLMFYGAIRFNQPLGDWKVEKVTDMGRMFKGASRFNRPIGDWNVKQVTTMESMFEEAQRFNQPIGDWEPINVTDMSRMFFNSPFDQSLANWKVDEETDQTEMFGGIYDWTRMNRSKAPWYGGEFSPPIPLIMNQQPHYQIWRA